MPLITWNNNLSVNVKGLDLQHQKLINSINQLHDAMTKGQSNQQLSGILNDLIVYTKTHFKSEEDLFVKYNYPEKQKHKEAHDGFVNKIEEFKTNFNEGKTSLSLDLMSFLNKWLIEHIKKMDKSYSDFLNSKGIG